MATERLPSLQALLTSAEGEKGRQLGFLLKDNTEPTDISFVGSKHFGEFQDVFVNYYADRRVIYGETLPLNFQDNFRLILQPKNHDALQLKDKDFLDENFHRQENDRFIWYDLSYVK